MKLTLTLTPVDSDAKHLPGRHDQSTHGRRRSGRPGVSQELSPEDTAAIKSYMTTRYREINGPLRDGQPLAPEDAGSVKRLDAVMGRTRTSEDLTVYRGMNELETFRDGYSKPPEIWPPENSVGAVIEDLGFVSTSHRRGAAENFGSVLFEINIPKGSPALDLRGHDYGLQEQEMLLPRGSSFRITSERQDGDRRIIGLELLPQGAASKTSGGPEVNSKAAAPARTGKVTPKERLTWDPSMVRLTQPKGAGSLKVFNEHLHPRDGDGQFADKPGVGGDKPLEQNPSGTKTAVQKSQDFQPGDHPRGHDGRFIRAGDHVSLPDGTTGRVVGVVGGGRVAVQRTDGGREIRAASEISQAKTTAKTGRAGHADLGSPKLTDKQQKAVDNYTSFAHHPINATLRSGHPITSYGQLSVEEMVDRLDSVMADSPLKDPITAWRGLSNDGHTTFDLSQLKPGALIVDKGFMSTSMDEDTAKGFARTGIRFKISVPAGSRALPIDGSSDKEAEVVLDRGSGMRVKRITGEKGNYVVEVELEQP